MTRIWASLSFQLFLIRLSKNYICKRTEENTTEIQDSIEF